MHRIVTEHPAVVDLERAIDESRARTETDKATINDEWAEYRAAAAHAARSGAAMPPEPGRTVASLDAGQRQREQVLADLRDETYRDHGAEMKASLDAREAELLAEARPHLAALSKIAAEMGELCEATRFVGTKTRRAGAPHIAPADEIYPQNDVGVGILAVAVANGLRFLGAPVVPRPTGHAAMYVERADGPSDVPWVA